MSLLTNCNLFSLLAAKLIEKTLEMGTGPGELQRCPGLQVKGSALLQNHRLTPTEHVFMWQLYVCFGLIFYFSLITTACLHSAYVYAQIPSG